MRWKIGGIVLGLALAAAAGASAYEEIEGWGPIKIGMPKAQFQAVPGLHWSMVRTFMSSPGRPWTIYRASEPQPFAGKSYDMDVSLLDDQVIEVTLRRPVDQLGVACKSEYEPVLAVLEKRFSPSEYATHYAAGTVLDADSDEDAVIERHDGLKSVSSVWRKAGLPTVVRTGYGVGEERLSATMWFAGPKGALRCTSLAISVH